MLAVIIKFRFDARLSDVWDITLLGFTPKN
jgi:hypothetical protein